MTDVPTTLRPAPFPLEGERVVVRGFRDEDAPAVFAAVQESIEHLRPWLSWYRSHPEVGATLDYLRRSQALYLTREAFHLGIFNREGNFLGGCGLLPRDWAVPSFEIGYWIRSSEEGKGQVTEAVRLVTAAAFAPLEAQRVMIRCDARNQRSANVARRLGYRHEGTLRHYDRDTEGNLADVMIFALTPEEYASAAV